MLFSDQEIFVGDSFLTLTPKDYFSNVFVVGASFRIGSRSLEQVLPPLALLTGNLDSTALGHTVYEHEYSPPKANGELLFISPVAVSRNGSEVEQLDVSISVGDYRREIVAVGPWSVTCSLLGIEKKQPIPVSEVSLGYENGFGGSFISRNLELDVCEENPVGKGWAISRGERGSFECPQVFWKGDEILFNRFKQVQPVGLTAVNRVWMPRRKYAGTYDEKWKRHFPYYPADFDPRFENSANAFLQFPKEELLGEIAIVGMSKEPIHFSLGDSGVLFLAAADNAADYISTVPDTLVLDCQKRLVHVRWRAHVSPTWHEKLVVCKSLDMVKSQQTT